MSNYGAHAQGGNYTADPHGCELRRTAEVKIIYDL